MELSFQWDEQRHRLTRVPDSPRCTREENMRYAAHTTAIRGEDKQAADVARYEMAKLAYESRNWYQPCKAVPGMRMPMFMVNADTATYTGVSTGLRVLSRLNNQREIEQAASKDQSVARASQFANYVHRVTTVEGYNEACCGALLMSHAWLKELNPEGDHAGILLLDGLVQEWYGIMEPAIETTARHAQAKHHAKNFNWLSGGWRRLWERP